jgi:hypothetical protein
LFMAFSLRRPTPCGTNVESKGSVPLGPSLSSRPHKKLREAKYPIKSH